MEHSRVPPGYQIYLLRVWREQELTPVPHGKWRFGLENTATKQRRGFKRLEEMAAFLAQSLSLPTTSDKD